MPSWISTPPPNGRGRKLIHDGTLISIENRSHKGLEVSTKFEDFVVGLLNNHLFFPSSVSFLQMISSNAFISQLVSSDSKDSEESRRLQALERSQRLDKIQKDNYATKSTFHSDSEGIRLVLDEKTTLDLRKGSVVQCDTIPGGTCILKVLSATVPGKYYPHHPIGFHYAVWSSEQERGWVEQYTPAALWPGAEGHYTDNGFVLSTMRLCDNPDGSPVPTYVAPPETPEERGRQLLAAFSAKWFTDVPSLFKGASLNYVDQNGDTILHYACRFKQTGTAHHLLNLDANASAVNKRGETPLHDACRGNDALVVRHILREGCPIDAPSSTGETPLMIACACFHDNLKVVETLLEHGADVNAKTNEGETPLIFACYNPSRDLEKVKKLVTLLLEAGAVVDVDVPPTLPYAYKRVSTPKDLCKDRESLLSLLNTPVEAPPEQLAVALERIEEARQKIASGYKWTDLNLRGLGLTQLPPIPEGLCSLCVEDNRLTTIDELPTSLSSLNCSKNRLVSLPSALPPALTHFTCNENRLSTLPPLPPTLVFLNCGGNPRLESLPPLDHLSQLVELYCGGNSLTELPPMSSLKLQRIWCSTNRLERLPPLKHLTALKQLRCGQNRLREIPEVPDTFHLLNCGKNKLTVLPPLPTHMVELFTDGNLAYLGYINKD